MLFQCWANLKSTFDERIAFPRIPVINSYWVNVVLMSVHSLRRWPDIKTTLCHITRDVYLMLVGCWSNVYDAFPTSKRYWLSVLLRFPRIPVNNCCWVNVVSMLVHSLRRWPNIRPPLCHMSFDQRLRRWPNIKPTLCQRIVFPGICIAARYASFYLSTLVSRYTYFCFYFLTLSASVCSSICPSVIYSPLRYGRVYLPLYKVADTPFHIQGDDYYLGLKSGDLRCWRNSWANAGPTLSSLDQHSANANNNYPDALNTGPNLK